MTADFKPWRYGRAVKVLWRIANGEGVPPELRDEPDPRPDLEDDSRKWRRLLLLARITDADLYARLRESRQRGSTLTWKNGNLALTDGVLELPNLDLLRAARPLLTDVAAIERELNTRFNMKAARATARQYARYAA